MANRESKKERESLSSSLHYGGLSPRKVCICQELIFWFEKFPFWNFFFLREQHSRSFGTAQTQLAVSEIFSWGQNWLFKKKNWIDCSCQARLGLFYSCSWANTQRIFFMIGYIWRAFLLFLTGWASVAPLHGLHSCLSPLLYNSVSRSVDGDTTNIYIFLISASLTYACRVYLRCWMDGWMVGWFLNMLNFC